MIRLATMGLVLCAGLCQAGAPAPSDFAWRAPLQLPAGAGMARVTLPGDALVRLQSSDARDLRVFNAAGEPVAFALMPTPKPPAAAAATTGSYAALPLYSPASGMQQPKGSTQVRIEEPGGQRASRKPDVSRCAQSARFFERPPVRLSATAPSCS